MVQQLRGLNLVCTRRYTRYTHKGARVDPVHECTNALSFHFTAEPGDILRSSEGEILGSLLQNVLRFKSQRACTPATAGVRSLQRVGDSFCEIAPWPRRAGLIRRIISTWPF